MVTQGWKGVFMLMAVDLTLRGVDLTLRVVDLTLRGLNSRSGG